MAESAPQPPVSAEDARKEATPAPPSAPADSATFTRCAACRHSSDVNSAAGTLVCHRHNMCINAEADEIPDDCPEHEPRA